MEDVTTLGEFLLWITAKRVDGGTLANHASEMVDALAVEFLNERAQAANLDHVVIDEDGVARVYPALRAVEDGDEHFAPASLRSRADHPSTRGRIRRLHVVDSAP